MLNVLVIGLGEIGKPLLEIVRGVHNAFGLDIQQEEIREEIDIVHICFPYSKDFVSNTVTS